MKQIFWSILSLLFGIILCYLAVQEWNRKSDLISGGDEVFATVIELVQRNRLYFAVVAYTYKGQNYEVETNEGSNPVSRLVGENVEIIVNPENPEDVEIKSFLNQKGKPLLLGIFGLLLLFFSVRILKGP